MNYSDKAITLNGIDYIVIKQVNYNNKNYVYLVNDKDKTDTMFGEIKNDEVFMIEPKLFQEIIFPLFLKEMKN